MSVNIWFHAAMISYHVVIGMRDTMYVAREIVPPINVAEFLLARSTSLRCQLNLHFEHILCSIAWLLPATINVCSRWTDWHVSDSTDVHHAAKDEAVFSSQLFMTIEER